VTAATDQPSVSFDLTGYPPGAYTVARSSRRRQERDSYYVDPELSRDSLFGIVEIAIAQAFYNAPPAFKISFEAREETLKYYVVASEFAGRTSQRSR